MRYRLESLSPKIDFYSEALNNCRKYILTLWNRKNTTGFSMFSSQDRIVLKKSARVFNNPCFSHCFLSSLLRSRNLSMTKMSEEAITFTKMVFFTKH